MVTLRVLFRQGAKKKSPEMSAGWGCFTSKSVARPGRHTGKVHIMNTIRLLNKPRTLASAVAAAVAAPALLFAGLGTAHAGGSCVAE